VPPTKAGVLLGLLVGFIPAEGSFRSFFYLGLAPPGDRIADQAAIKRNATDYEDQEAVALSFTIRISARVTQASFLFMEQPAQCTTVRLEAFTKARTGIAETLLGTLVTIAQG